MAGIPDKKVLARNRAHDWWTAHKSRVIDNNRKRMNKYKKMIYDFYGSECVCCGESNMFFLSVDHKNNDGYDDRRNKRHGNGLYLHIIKEGFPDKYQILCMNCNHGKMRNNGVCPHFINV